MHILVVGSGGREHALCWALAASPLCDRLTCAPGNAGIASEPGVDCRDVGAEDIEGLLALCREEKVDFVVVGPEAPLVAGLVDRLGEAGVKAFGPNRAAAVLEGSKAFVKDLCARHKIPTAAYGRFRDLEAAKAYVREQGSPLVVKADGLAAGKGVILCETQDEALAAVEEMLSAGAFGTAGEEIVVEAFMRGEEASLFVLVDGKNILPLAAAQDHKRVGEGDQGPNTGGMGAYSPPPVMTEEITRRALDEIIRPTVAAMAAEGRPFKGLLFAGLMMTDEGPQLLEYNVRFGDPECQVLMTRLKSDLLPALLACADGQLGAITLRWREEAALVVVMAALGYPGAYEKGSRIEGLEAADKLEGVKVFHAGTVQGADGAWLASGGRVLGVTGLGKDVVEARDRAYAGVEAIDWPGGFCRRDIGWRVLGEKS